MRFLRDETGAAARKRLMRRSGLRRMGCDEVDVVRSARPREEKAVDIKHEELFLNLRDGGSFYR